MNENFSLRIVGPRIIRINHPVLGGATVSLDQLRLVSELWKSEGAEPPAHVRLALNLLEASK